VPGVQVKDARLAPITTECAARTDRTSGDSSVAKITVNGVTYDSVEAMPPEVKRIYEQTMANFPELADRDGDGIPDMVQGQGVSVRSVVRKKFIVNGTTYDDVKDLPAEARQAYETALRASSIGSPTVQKDEIKLSFQIDGAGFHFGKRSGAPSLSPSMSRAAGPVSVARPAPGTPIPKPIEPAPIGGVLRIALAVGACVAGALMLWLRTRPH